MTTLGKSKKSSMSRTTNSTVISTQLDKVMQELEYVAAVGKDLASKA